MPIRPPTLKELGNEFGFDLSAMVIPAAQVSGAVSGVVSNIVTALNVKIDYGATGDGVTNDTTAIQNAINAANAAGGGTVFFPPGTYFVSTSLTHKSNVTLQGSGMGVSILKFSNTSNTTMIAAAGTLSNTTTLTAQANIGDRVIALTSAAGYAVGDTIMVYASASGNVAGFVTRVGAISVNNVTLEEDCTHTFLIANAQVFKMTPVTKAHVRDLTIQSPTGNNLDSTVRKSGALSYDNYLECEVERVEFKGIAGDTGLFGVLFRQGRDFKFCDNRFDHCGDSDPSPSQFTIVLSIFQATGAMVQRNYWRRSGGSGCASFVGTGHTTFSNNVLGGETNWASYVDTTTPLTIDNGGRGVKYSDGNNYFVCANNVIHDAGFDGIRCESVQNFPNNFGVISGNQIVFAHDLSIGITDTNDVTVTGNHIDQPSSGNGTFHGIFVQNCARANITGNNLHNIYNDAIHFQSAVTDSNIANNIIVCRTTGTGISLGATCTRVTITGNQISTPSANAIDTTASSGANLIGGNITSQAYALHAGDTLLSAKTGKFALTYSASVTPDAAASAYQTLAITNGTAFTINAPTNPTSGFELTLDIKNSSGGAHGVITFSATYLGGGAGTVGTGAFTGIANGKRRLIIFRYDSTTWQEVSRTADQ